MRYKNKRYVSSNGPNQLVRSGVGLAVGSVALGALGGTVANNANAGLVNASGFLPVVGTLQGVGMVANASRGLVGAAKKLGRSRR